MFRLLNAFLLMCAVSASEIDVVVHNNGSYTVIVGGKAWLQAGPTFLMVQGTKYSNVDQSLKVQSISTFRGDDSLGAYNGTRISWLADTTPFETSFQTYREQASVVFSQYFPEAVSSGGTGDSKDLESTLLSSFPSVLMDDPQSEDHQRVTRGYLGFNGRFMEGSKAGGFAGGNPSYSSGAAAGPLAIFDEDLVDIVMFSPFSQFMAASINTEDRLPANFSYLPSKTAVETGILGSITEVPAGFEYKAIMRLGQGKYPGIGGTVKEWGDLLLGYYGKTPSLDQDVSLLKLGFSTDNGAFYYGHTEKGEDYEQTVMAVKDYARSVGIPYQYILLDSWWYYKGDGGGVKNWTSMASVFPDGMEGLYKKTGWKVQGHNRYWSDNTDYARQNGGAYDFVVEPENNLAIPNSTKFWDDLMANATEWGLAVYEQDWLYNEFDGMNVTRENIQMGRDWLMQMGEGAAKNGLTIQYCMSYPRHILQSVEIPAVSQFRAGDDYHPGQSTNCQFPYCVYYIGTTSIAGWALGLAPAKDDWWSTDKVQEYPWNPRYGNDTEPYNLMEATISALSTGPVQPSDAVNFSNAALILMTSTAYSGTLLKPSKPAMAIDACLAQAAFGDNQAADWGEDGPNESVGPIAARENNYPVQSTHTQVSGLKWAEVLVIALKEDFNLLPVHLPLDLNLALQSDSDRSKYNQAATTHVAWTGHGVGAIGEETTNTSLAPNGTTFLGEFSTSSPLRLHACNFTDFQQYHVAPVLSNRWSYLGELHKIVPVSTFRSRKVVPLPASGRGGGSDPSSGVQVTIMGDAGEVVELLFADGNQQWAIMKVRCAIGASGTATVTVSHTEHSCA